MSWLGIWFVCSGNTARGCTYTTGRQASMETSKTIKSQILFGFIWSPTLPLSTRAPFTWGQKEELSQQVPTGIGMGKCIIPSALGPSAVEGWDGAIPEAPSNPTCPFAADYKTDSEQILTVPPPARKRKSNFQSSLVAGTLRSASKSGGSSQQPLVSPGKLRTAAAHEPYLATECRLGSRLEEGASTPLGLRTEGSVLTNSFPTSP